MALTPTIYRATIAVADVERSLYEQLTASVARHPSETAERLVLRLLAWGLFWSPELAFTRGIAAGDEPDLWSRQPDGRIATWVEVGLPDPERLIKAARHCNTAFLLAGGRQRRIWESQHLSRLAASTNLGVYALESDFLNELAGRIERSIDWSLTLSDGVLYLNDRDASLSAQLEHLCGPERSAAG